MILNAAIYCTLVVEDIVIVGSAEPWLISRGENAIAPWATLLSVDSAETVERETPAQLPFRCRRKVRPQAL
jgi:hypothetical protein